MTLLGKLAAHDVKHMSVARSVWANVAMNQQKFQFCLANMGSAVWARHLMSVQIE